MDQGTHRLLFVLGGTVTLSLGVLVACSDDGQFSQLPTAPNNTVDSGSQNDDDDDDDDQDQDDEENPTDGGAKDGGDGGLCSGASYPKSVSDVFCFKGADGQNLYCKPKPDSGVPQVCCGDAQNDQGTFATQNSCAAAGACTWQSGYNPGNEYQCLEERHCATGQKCCLLPGTVGAVVPKADNKYGTCGQYFVPSDYKKEKIKGTACKATCAGTDILLCAEDSDCPSGKTCHYIKLNGRNSGVCE